MSTLDSIELFLNAAEERIKNAPGRIPFDAQTGKLVIAWLRVLAPHYANGEDIEHANS